MASCIEAENCRSWPAPISRRLFDRPHLGFASRRLAGHPDRRDKPGGSPASRRVHPGGSPRAGRYAAANHWLRARSRRRAVDRGPRRRLVPTGGRAGRRTVVTISNAAFRNRFIRVGRRTSSARGVDSILGQRSAVVRRRIEKNGSSRCRACRESTSPNAAAGTVPTGPCWSRLFHFPAAMARLRQRAASKRGCSPNSKANGKGFPISGMTSRRTRRWWVRAGAERLSVAAAARRYAPRANLASFPAARSAWSATRGRRILCWGYRCSK